MRLSGYKHTISLINNKELEYQGLNKVLQALNLCHGVTMNKLLFPRLINISDLIIPTCIAALFMYPVQIKAALPEEEFFSEIPVVLTATRLKQPINEAPASMTIIDRQMIEASGARNVADVFQLVPGFMVQYEVGHTPIVTYHGMSDQYSRWMQVLIDGRSVYTLTIGGVEWSQIPLVLDEIERIEVTRGPNAASYGSNAFAATINIITRHTTDTNGIFFRLNRGTPNNLNDALIQYGNSANLSNGSLDYRLTLGRLTDDGFDHRYDILRANLARFRLDYSDGGSNSWFLAMGLINGPRGLDHGNNFDYPERNHERDTDYNFQQIRWTHALSSNEEVYVNYYHNYNKVDETYSYTLTNNPKDKYFWTIPLPGVTVTAYNSFRTDRHDIEIQHTLIPSENWKIAWGGSFRQDQFYSPGYIHSNSTEYVNLSRLFANTEWQSSNNLKVNMGAMWEYSDFTGASLSPRFGLVYQLERNHNLRAVVTRATRIPSIIEYDGELIFHLSGSALGGYGLPDPSYDTYILGTKDLDNEIITSFELGLNNQYPDIGLSTDIKLFQDRVTDVVYFAVVPDVVPETGPIPAHASPTNGGDVTIRGIEFQSDLNHFYGNRIFFSYAITNIVESSVLPNNDNSEFTDSAPHELFSVLFSHRFENNATASFIMKHASRYEGLGTGNRVKGFNRADIRFSIPYQINKLSGEISLVSQNISGSDYFDWGEYNDMNIRHILSITGMFK